MIRVADDKGLSRSIELNALSAVTIETNDSGPWGADFWWLLHGPDDAIACAFPLGATGEGAAMAQLTALPGFDHRSMGEAMASTRNAVFPVWRREQPSRSEALRRLAAKGLGGG